VNDRQLNHHAGALFLALFFVLCHPLVKGRAVASDSVRTDSVTVLDFGDPTNTDIPRFGAPSGFRRSEFYGTGKSAGRLVRPPGLLESGTVDSLLQTITLRDNIQGLPLGLPRIENLDDYLKRRPFELYASAKDSSLARYELSKVKSENEILKLLDQATNLTIPLPPSPIFGIFGKPEIGINVNGEVNVRAGWRWDTQNLGTASVLGQTQSSPIFSQNIQVNVSARIGDKFRFNTDWNTLNQFEFNNRFKVGYEGYDDDIIKRVEFGNVNLETNSTLIGGGQTLFGLRADFQFGPLYIKTIASQRRSERQFLNAAGGSSKSYFAVRAYDYVRNHFFLDTAYFKVWDLFYSTFPPVLPASTGSLVVKEIVVWESTTEVSVVQANEAVAYADLDPIQYKRGQRYPDAMKNGDIKAGEVERGRFVQLDPKRYEVDVNLGTLTILNLRSDRFYAVSYRYEGESALTDEDDLYVGTLPRNAGEKDTLILKLVSRQAMQPGFKTLWKRLMKNVYTVGLTNVNPTDANIGMWYYRNTNDSTDILEGAPDKVVTIFKLDQVNNSTGALPPDGIFDARPPVFNPQRGEITFPNREPFRDGLREYFAKQGNAQLAEQYVFNEVYDTTDQAARLNTAKDRFLIVGEASGTASGSRIPLAFNVAPGSVKVKLDGQDLREGVDYSVDYYGGTLSLLNPRATLPNANLSVEYERNDVFNLTTRTLAGLRADYQLFKKRNLTGRIGMTLMNYDVAALVDRVQPNQEPNANLMWGFDTELNANLPWLTRFIDDLPIIDTKTKSNFVLKGEWAMVNPNPNKRQSSVLSDDGKPVAYVDDFEGARRIISFGLTPGVWSHSSPFPDITLWPDDTTAQNFRGRTFWYQRFVPDVPQSDVYPNRSQRLGQTNINPMRIVFDPAKRGIYNMNPQFLDSENPRWFDPDSLQVRDAANNYRYDNSARTWGGLMRLLSPFNTNFDNDNIDYIEIMMKIEDYEPGSKMYIDLGQISEDVIPNQKLNTEDRYPPNNIIDEGEDIGLDTLSNQQEKESYPYPLNLEADPARDDYFFDFSADRQNQNESQFVKYNNYENNSTQSELGQFPDTEILNKNNGQTIMLDNSYFRYEVRLDPNPATNPQIIGGNPDKGWYLFRIPVRRPDTVVGNPLYTNIQYVRLAFRGGRVKLAIADWSVVGSYWLARHNFQPGLRETDSVLQVAYVNREENQDAPDFYSMPPGVSPPQQLQNPDPFANLYLNEQSLRIDVQNMKYGEERMAARRYTPWDLFYYKELAFFIHGDNTMPDHIDGNSIPPAYAFIRFGVDSANYYEMRRPLLRGWQDIRIPVENLTAIKQVRDATRINERQEFPVPNDPSAVYAIKGSPILNRVSFFAFGIENPSERYPSELTTSMWVDELRVVDPIRDNDWAAIATASVNLADLADVAAAVNVSTPNFHKLEERFGDRNTVTSWNVTVNSSLEKLLPKGMKGAKIPITYTHSEYFQQPRYQAQNDVLLDAAAEATRVDTLRKGATEEVASQAARQVIERSETLRIQDQWAITGLKLGIPSSAWYAEDILNKLTFNFSYAQEYQRTQVVQSRFEWLWRFKADYAVTIPNTVTVSPFKFLDGVYGLKIYKDVKFNFLPQNITANAGFERGRTTEQSRYLSYPSPIVRNFIGTQSVGFNWRLVENGLLNPTIDYKLTNTTTLAPLELDINGRQRSASELFGEMFFSNGRLFNFGQTGQYDQVVTISMRPRLPAIAGLDRLIETTASYSVTFGLVDPLAPDPAQRDIVRNARFNSQFRISPVFRWGQFGQSLFGPIKHTDKSTLGTLGYILKDIFFGFENFTFLFNQNSNANNGGVMGETGFTNFWARSVTFRANQPSWGPSTAYQLGLNYQPHGNVVLAGSSSFPFFKFETTPGLRPPNGVMMDNYDTKSTFQLQTNRPLWPGATLDIIAKTDIGFSINQRVITDQFGNPTFTNVLKRQIIDRTFISFPNFFPFSLANNNVDNVLRMYNERKAVIMATANENDRNTLLLEALNTSFREGFESFQLWSGEAAKVLPALNWTLRWDGIEKLWFLKGIAQRIFLEHGYQSTYKESATITDNGRVTDVQEVRTGFSPLIGLNLSFDERALEGMLTATARYSITQAHSLSGGARGVIQQENTHELQIQASYLKRGMNLRFIGLELKNDLEISLLTQMRKNIQARFEVDEYPFTQARTVNGTTQLTIEPRARYTISNRVTASAFIRYEGNFSEGASTPGFSSTQFGVDIRLSISGGR